MNLWSVFPNVIVERSRKMTVPKDSPENQSLTLIYCRSSIVNYPQDSRKHQIIFYIDVKIDSEILEETTIPTIKAGGSIDVSTTWKAERGQHTIYAKVVKDKSLSFLGPNEETMVLDVKAKPPTAGPIDYRESVWPILVMAGFIGLGILYVLFKVWRFTDFFKR